MQNNKLRSANRIVIIGCPGAGKTTLSLLLAKHLSLPVYHLDKFYWQKNWEHLTQEEFLKAITPVLSESRWIVDGNYVSTLKYRLQFADAVVFFHFNPYFCLLRVIGRWWKNRGQVRFDMGEGCADKLDWPFIRWILRFERVVVPEILKTLSAFDGEVIHLKTMGDLKKYEKEILSR
jgi:adenylate kinase family enzyme